MNTAVSLKSQLKRSQSPITWYIEGNAPQDAREQRIWEEYGFKWVGGSWEYQSQRAPRVAMEIILDDLEAGLA